MSGAGEVSGHLLGCKAGEVRTPGTTSHQTGISLFLFTCVIGAQQNDKTIFRSLDGVHGPPTFFYGTLPVSVFPSTDVRVRVQRQIACEKSSERVVWDFLSQIFS